MIWRCWILLLLAMQAGAQSRWTGAALNNQWMDPGNWEAARVPGLEDDVWLDNSLFGSGYHVLLPNSAVQVRSLRIFPAAGFTIVVELPATNSISSAAGSLAARAFETLGDGHSLHIGAGGKFLNASGSSSGYSVRFNDSISIGNGGSYVHRTRTGHAELVQQLSRQAGTETGIFRFENTDAASTFSLSGRTFGTIQLSAAASAAGIVTYSSSGTNRAVVRGNLELEPGVNFSLHFDDTIWVKGDLRLDTAWFNLSGGNRAPVVLLQGNWLQKGGGIHETNGTGKIPTIVLGGSSPQVVNSSGLLTDSVLLSIQNPAGVRLDAALRLPYGLELIRGVVSAGEPSRLFLAKGCLLDADSSSGQSYIEGELVREAMGGEYFLFPLGAGGKQRWISLKGVQGDLAVSYHRESALNIGQNIGAGLDHISQLEYWQVRKPGEGVIPVLEGQLELSFEEEYSGGVSYLPDLRVAAFTGGSWEDAGNSATTGAAFARGSVSSKPIGGIGMDRIFFTLASASALSNVLPVLFQRVWMEASFGRFYLNWKVSGIEDATTFEIELSKDGRVYTTAEKIPALFDHTDYRVSIPDSWLAGYCRVKCTDKNGRFIYSKPLRFAGGVGGVGGSSDLRILQAGGASGLVVGSAHNTEARVEITDVAGRLLFRKELVLARGINQVELNRTLLPVGMYIVRVQGKNGAILVRQMVF